MDKKIAFVIKTSQEFIRHSESDAEKYAPEFNSLFESVSNTFIPLLNMLGRFEEKSVNAAFGLVVSPIFCSLMENETVQNMYIEWLDKRIQLGNEELARVSDNQKLVSIIKRTIDNYATLKTDFEEKYQKLIVKKLAEYHQKGSLELIATCGTDIFVPHYIDLQEVISAQIEIGLQAYRQSFGCFPDGFWLPELGYSNGVEKLIRAYGYSYTLLDARGVLLANQYPSKGIFYPARTENSLAVFAVDPDLNENIYGESGFAVNPVYRNENRDIGFNLPMDNLSALMHAGSPRFSTGYKYWNKSLSAENELYDFEAAKKQACEDAKNFLDAKKVLLTHAGECISDSDYVVSVCALDASKLKQEWSEWILWFEQVLLNAKDNDLTVVKCNEMLEKQFSLEKINPYYSSSAGEGYGEDLLSSKNCWMMRYSRKASERMIDLADRFPNDTGLKTRLLNLGAKELLIAQSLGISKMIENDEFPEYAEKRFKESIAAFTAVFDSLGSNTVSTEWLTKLEEKDDFYPWINYRVFSKKK
mgnify:CR=1 FL=1